MKKPTPNNNERRKLVHLRLEYDDGCFRHVSIEPEAVKFQLFYPDMKPVLEEQTMTREAFIRDIASDITPERVELFLEIFSDGLLLHDIGPHLGCLECEALCGLLEAFDEKDAADTLREGHSLGDEEGDMPEHLAIKEAEEADADDDKCTKCGARTDNGEGYDGLCGNCADKKEPA